jgi:hypothetical protein
MDASDEESDMPEIRIAAGVDSRSLAASWAASVLHGAPSVREQDKPYMLAMLTEASMMELPIKTLAVAINEHSSNYAVTIKGYKGLMSIRQWYTHFLSKGREHMLDNVTDVFVQLTDVGAIITVHLKKVKFHAASVVGGAASSSVSVKRGMAAATAAITDNSTTPSGGRRIRKH